MQIFNFVFKYLYLITNGEKWVYVEHYTFELLTCPNIKLASQDPTISLLIHAIAHLF